MHDLHKSHIFSLKYCIDNNFISFLTTSRINFVIKALKTCCLNKDKIGNKNRFMFSNGFASGRYENQYADRCVIKLSSYYWRKIDSQSSQESWTMGIINQWESGSRLPGLKRPWCEIQGHFKAKWRSFRSVVPRSLNLVKYFKEMQNSLLLVKRRNYSICFFT